MDSPSEAAHKISASWRDSVFQLIEASERIYQVLEAYSESEPKLSQFIVGLVKGRVLTEREGKMGIGSPKLSKLRTIGEHADILRRKSIVAALTPEYSVLYQLCVLYRKAPGDNQQTKVKKLETVVQKCRGELSREYLASETKRLKRKTKRSDVSSEVESETEPARRSTLRELIAKENTFDLILLTPARTVLALFEAEYERNVLEECLPLFKLIDHSRPTALVVATAISDLATVETRLLPLCGFSSVSSVLLLEKPANPDVTDAPVILFAVKGTKLRRDVQKERLWTAGAGSDRDKALATAESAFPSLGSRLHVFAERSTDGWISLIGDKSWIELPSIR